MCINNLFTQIEYVFIGCKCENKTTNDFTDACHCSDQCIIHFQFVTENP